MSDIFVKNMTMITSAQIETSMKDILIGLSNKYNKKLEDITIKLSKDRKCFFFSLIATIYGDEKLGEMEVDELLKPVFNKMDLMARLAAPAIIRDKLKEIFESEAKKHNIAQSSFAISIYYDDKLTLKNCNGIEYLDEIDLKKYFS